MAIEKVNIDQFLLLSGNHPIFDVRSPAEFLHAHIPGAYSLPLFTDEERKIVGTAYKQQSRQDAIKIGLDFFGVKMKKMVEEVEQIIRGRQISGNGKQAITNTVLVHCWRGGMRSTGVAWLLDLYGYKVYALVGGYKAFRNWILQQFDKEYNFKILGGYTGSGKTVLLKELKRLGHPVIDLEGLANHKGSAFGAEGEKQQPGQEMFENLFGIQLFQQKIKLKKEPLHSDRDDQFTSVWLEDESRAIGSLNIPNNIWYKMRNSPLYFIEIPFEERLDYLVATYGSFKKENLVNAILRIRKRLGNLETKNAINFLLTENIRESFSIILKYYDKYYNKGLNERNLKNLVNKLPFENVNIENVNAFRYLQTLAR
jgi:tRNA 2-selenouridine synthase